jgi:hypothetical protein
MLVRKPKYLRQNPISQIPTIVLALLIVTTTLLKPLAAADISYATQEEILIAVIGNSMSGIEEGQEWEENYKPGKIKKGIAKGKIKGKWGKAKEKYTGKWSIKEDGLMCFKYPNGEGNGCWYLVIVNGSTVQWYKEDGSRDGEDASLFL